MVYASKANRVIQIAEADIETFVIDGYVIKDENGKVLRQTAPTDITLLRNEYISHISEIESLKLENESLKAEIEKLKKSSKSSKTDMSNTDSDEVETKPVRKKKSTGMTE